MLLLSTGELQLHETGRWGRAPPRHWSHVPQWRRFPDWGTVHSHLSPSTTDHSEHVTFAAMKDHYLVLSPHAGEPACGYVCSSQCPWRSRWTRARRLTWYQLCRVSGSAARLGKVCVKSQVPKSPEILNWFFFYTHLKLKSVKLKVHTSSESGA